MVPPETFSISAAQAWVAGTSGCAGGTHSDTFMVTVLSCASAGVTLAATSSAKNAFLIDVFSLVPPGLYAPLRILLYDIIIIASCAEPSTKLGVGPVRRTAGPYNNRGSKCCGQK